MPNTKERAEDTCPPIYQCRLPLSTNTVNHLADLLRAHLKAIRSRWRILTPGKIAVIVLAVLRHDQRLAHLRTAGLGALADLGFRGLDNDLLDPVIVTGYTVTRTHKLTPGQKTATASSLSDTPRPNTASPTSRTGGPSPNSASTPPAPPASFALCSTSAP